MKRSILFAALVALAAHPSPCRAADDRAVRRPADLSAVRPVPLPHVPATDENGKADIGFGCITITEERKKSVDFTDCYYDGGFAMLVRRNGDVA